MIHKPTLPFSIYIDNKKHFRPNVNIYPTVLEIIWNISLWPKQYLKHIKEEERDVFTTNKHAEAIE